MQNFDSASFFYAHYFAERCVTFEILPQVTYRRIKLGLTALDKNASGPASHLVSVLFRETPARSAASTLPPRLTQPDGHLILFNRKNNT